ncbi:MAG: carboxymuconolactone decarboxylase family protein [Gemmatimonadota bacterium]|nr:carboxymuconolactone decarboxylase family protein [Gemmatimonadota bacterium]MDE3126898.1 carboxymuconolactone decarboxylase family protein [Gemmatimonadota bacterium]MDE3172679.1 carboxymuconolactone decarboxylase family protein [Gemmatimonadota bacterium]
MTHSATVPDTLMTLDDATRRLVRLSAAVTAGTEARQRSEIAESLGAVPHAWVEELLLQSYLFAGFPRALNAMREWRRVAPEPSAPGAAAPPAQWRADGERTCAVVYGRFYDRLRENIRHLHPALDDWMIVEGYGKVLSRPGLDLGRRELCIVAACAAAGQDRQLHSHLHGALNAGVAAGAVSEAIEALAGVVPTELLETARLLWARVRGK